MAKQSLYLRQLTLENPMVAQRYVEKIANIANEDPFCFQHKDLDNSFENIPPIKCFDIITYLVLTHSFYTNEQMKAHKSLEAFKYFEAGFVNITGWKKYDNNMMVIVGEVKHSQRMRERSLHSWIIIEIDGSIRTAHCTCMAGNSEVCSHVGALLYAIEYAYSSKLHTSCTDVKSAWPVPSMKEVPIVPVSQMCWNEKKSNQKEIVVISKPSVSSVLNRIKEKGGSSALERIVEPFASTLMAEAEKPLTHVFDIYNKIHENETYSQLLDLADGIDVSISSEMKSSIQKRTCKQRDSKDWHIQRSGRITASNFKSVCRTKIDAPSLSLIKSVCYPREVKFCTKATQWGIQNERKALEEYFNFVYEQHEDLTQIDVGLIVNLSYPQFGASPDKVVSCKCCNTGCVEIKCPYTLYICGESLEEFSAKNTSCLVMKDNNITLDREHAYYFQVQMQIFLGEFSFTDFVVWSPHTMFIERIYPDEGFWQVQKEKALNFHRKIIMPELLGRFYTKRAKQK